MTKQILEKFRNQASDLIKQNKINQCFETSALTGEGVDNLRKYLKLVSTMIFEEKKMVGDLQKTKGKINEDDKLNIKDKLTKKFLDNHDEYKLNKLKKFINY